MSDASTVGVQAIPEALTAFAMLANACDAAIFDYLGVGLDGLLPDTTLPVGGEAIRDKCTITIGALLAARAALAAAPATPSQSSKADQGEVKRLRNALVELVGATDRLVQRTSTETCFYAEWEAARKAVRMSNAALALKIARPALACDDGRPA